MHSHSAPPSKRRLPRTALAVCAALALATGCSGGDDDTDDAASAATAQPSSTPKVTASEDLEFPVAAYLLTSDEHASINEAQGALVTRCMKRFGFDFQPEQAIGQAPADDTAKGASAAVNAGHRYGLTDAEAARSRGFRAATPPAQKPAKPQVSEAEMKVLGGSGPLTQDGRQLNKEQESVGGKKIPPGGCIGEAQTKLRGDAVFGDLPAARDINRNSLALSRERPDVRKAVKAWTTCMKSAGFTTDDPLDPTKGAAEYHTAQPTQQEIDLAVADVDCKKKTNLVGIWYASDTAIQAEMIEKKSEELREGKAEQRKMLTRAAQITGS